MRRLLERLVSFRLSDAAYRRYEREAAEAGLTLSKYLRSRLEAEDSVADHVEQLRLALVDNGAGAGVDANVLPILVELLLLARRHSSPGDMRTVHAELERQGMHAWAPSPL